MVLGAVLPRFGLLSFEFPLASFLCLRLLHEFASPSASMVRATPVAAVMVSCTAESFLVFVGRIFQLILDRCQRCEVFVNENRVWLLAAALC